MNEKVIQSILEYVVEILNQIKDIQRQLERIKERVEKLEANYVARLELKQKCAEQPSVSSPSWWAVHDDCCPSYWIQPPD